MVVGCTEDTNFEYSALERSLDWSKERHKQKYKLVQVMQQEDSQTLFQTRIYSAGGRIKQ